MANIEIKGLDKVKSVLASVNDDLRPIILRDIARKPAQKASSIARNLQPIGDTGQTARTIGILKVKNSKQPFVEVGYRGRSLGHIYTSGERIVRHLRGVVKGFPNLFHNAGALIQGNAKGEMKADITKAFVKAFKKRGIG